MPYVRYISLMKHLINALVIASMFLVSCNKDSDTQQPPTNQSYVPFKKVFGGSSYDAVVTSAPALDGGYIFSGVSQSTDGDLTAGYGLEDLWLFKLDVSGNLVWSKTYGGSFSEYPANALVTANDGYIIAGATESTDGNVSITKDDFRQHWLFKVDLQGNIIWQKKFSNIAGAQIFRLKKAKNGDLIGAGYTSPPGADAVAWLFRLTADGTLIWEKTYHALTENIADVSEAANGDLFITGTVVETGNPQQDDAFVMRTSSAGDSIWLKPLGGTVYDRGSGILATSDGGAIMTGLSNSSDGNATGGHGGFDILVIKIDGNGNVQWNKMFGGAAEDGETSFAYETGNNNYIITATPYGVGGDMPSSREYDAWILTLSADGNIVDKKTFGGNGVDYIYNLLPVQEGRFLAAGTTSSLDGDITGSHGGYEGWVFTVEY
jgi:hypothetical protein